MKTLHLVIEPNDGAQAIALECGDQTSVAVPYPEGTGYRDALRFKAVEISWNAMAPITHNLNFRREIISVTTGMRSIDNKLKRCAVFILGSLIGKTTGSPRDN